MSEKFLTRYSVPLEIGDRSFPVTVLDDDATLWVPVHATFGVLPGDAVIPAATFFDVRKGGMAWAASFEAVPEALRLERAGEGVAAIPLALFRKLAASGDEGLCGAVEAWAAGAVQPVACRSRALRWAGLTRH